MLGASTSADRTKSSSSEPLTYLSICLVYLLAAVLKVSEVRVTSSASNEAQTNF
ncbi:MAG: hypothetical protein SO144_04640 [Campylobacter sp.]|nr:hypothetical protein [Campylobacter sp.]